MNAQEKTIKVQWLTTDKTLFELDWLTFLLGHNPDNIVSNPRQLDLYPKTILVVNRGLPYREVLDQLRYKQYKYGIILLSDENLTEPLEFLHDPSCLFLARNYIHPMYLSNPKVITFGLGYKRGFNNEEIQIANVKDRALTWSFAGTLHGTRPEMLQVFKDIDLNAVHTCSGFGAADGLGVSAYRKLLNNSKFALCPPGQDSTDTFRIYEALEAGCIPVTLNNAVSKESNRMTWKLLPSYWHGIFEEDRLPFIHAESWAEAKKLMLQTISNNDTQRMQVECQTFWKNQKDRWAEKFRSLIQE